MVLRETKGGSSLKIKKNNTKIWILVSIGVFMMIFTVFLLIFLNSNRVGDEAAKEVVEESINQTSAEEIAETTEVKAPKQINFQPVIDQWAATTGGTKSVIIYDIEREELAGSYNVDDNYAIASLYKLFVVYEGYRRVESGEWALGMEVSGTDYNVGECLDLAIRESYSPCAEVMLGMIGRSELSDIIEGDFGVLGSDVVNLVSNAPDILKIMLLFYKHPDIKRADLVAMMKDSFLNQPATTYDWRQGLPSGFTVANVYNKVGWNYDPDAGKWDLYHDAAIVEFPEDDRHFVVIVMTNDLSFTAIRRLGADIEAYYLENR